MPALEREYEKVKTQHVSRKSEGLILLPCQPKGKCDPTCLKVLWPTGLSPANSCSSAWLDLNGPKHFLCCCKQILWFISSIGTAHVSKDKQRSNCLQYLWPRDYVVIFLRLWNVWKFLTKNGQGGKKSLLSMKVSCHHHLLPTSSPQALLMGPVFTPLLWCTCPFQWCAEIVQEKFDEVIILLQSAQITYALLFSLNTNVQRRWLLGRKKFSKLFPMICYFSSLVLMRHIGADLEEKMLLVCLSVTKTLLFVWESSSKTKNQNNNHHQQQILQSRHRMELLSSSLRWKHECQTFLWLFQGFLYPELCPMWWLLYLFRMFQAIQYFQKEMSVGMETLSIHAPSLGQVSPPVCSARTSN